MSGGQGHIPRSRSRSDQPSAVTLWQGNISSRSSPAVSPPGWTLKCSRRTSAGQEPSAAAFSRRPTTHNPNPQGQLSHIFLLEADVVVHEVFGMLASSESFTAFIKHVGPKTTVVPDTCGTLFQLCTFGPDVLSQPDLIVSQRVASVRTQPQALLLGLLIPHRQLTALIPGPSGQLRPSRSSRQQCRRAGVVRGW